MWNLVTQKSPPSPIIFIHFLEIMCPVSPALPCPPLQPPRNGSSVQCSSSPVYGETCIFKCNQGMTSRGTRARTCVLSGLSPSNAHVHWTGRDLTCKGKSPEEL